VSAAAPAAFECAVGTTRPTLGSSTMPVMSVLRAVAEVGRMDLLALLLAEPVSPACPRNSHTLALSDACRRGAEDVAAALLADGRAVPSTAALSDAVQRGHTGVVRLLLADPRTKPGSLHSQVLAIACLYHRVEILGLLLADGRAKPAAQPTLLLRTLVPAAEAMLLADTRTVIPRLADAVATGSAQLVRLVLRRSTEHIKPLHMAAAMAVRARLGEGMYGALREGFRWQQRRLWLRVADATAGALTTERKAGAKPSGSRRKVARL
jgi:hypothetical protein